MSSDDLSKQDLRPNSELYDASRDADKLQQLIESGVRVESDPSPQSLFILHAAAGEGDARIVDLLLGAGGEQIINQYDDLNWTPLTWAAKYGRLDVMKLLLDRGANVNAHNEALAGPTPLGEVVNEAAPEVVKLLLDRGADPTIPGFMGMTAIDDAEKRFNERPDEDAAEVLRLLRASERNLPAL